MAYTASVTKNGFNKTRATKINLFKKLLNEVHTCSYPNGNSGYEQGVIIALAERFPQTITYRSYGNPHTMGHVTFDPTALTNEEAALIESWLVMVDGLPVDDFHPRGGWKVPEDGYWEDRRWIVRQTVFQKMQADVRPYYSRMAL